MEVRVISGNIRSIDSVGRTVIPVDMRERLGWKIGDRVEIDLLANGIFVKAYRPGCYICGRYEGIKDFRGYKMCQECRKEIGML